MNNFWDEKFKGDDYLYGVLPNEQVKLFIDDNLPGSVLFVGEGEGRNAVYAAKKQYLVTAFDLSKEAKRKALALAKHQNVDIDYYVEDLLKSEITDASFDYVVLCFLHMMPELRVQLHKKIEQLLKPKGKLFIVGFTESQLTKEYKSGGPKNIDMLYTQEKLSSDFSGLSNHKGEILECQLDEGTGHAGIASLLVFEAVKD